MYQTMDVDFCKIDFEVDFLKIDFDFTEATSTQGTEATSTTRNTSDGVISEFSPDIVPTNSI